MVVKVYKVRATRWEHANGWELDIDDVGVTQAVSVARLEETVRSYLRLEGKRDADTAQVDVTYVLPGKLGERVAHTLVAQERFDAAREDLRDSSRETVRGLLDAGYKGGEIAAILGVSNQRVSQLADGVRGKVAARA